MRTIFYSDNKTNSEMGFDSDFIRKMPDIENETISSPEELSTILCTPLNEIAVIIAAPSSVKTLSGLVEMKALFDNVRMILVLPDRSRHALLLGSKLSPSFITYRDNDAGDIISVLNKINEKRG